jgi:hypothetical protein
MVATALTLPTIHMNGTAGADLLAAYLAALEALRLASVALQATAPNGRDYYPQGDAAILAAGQEHRTRVAALTALMVEVEALALHVADA